MPRGRTKFNPEWLQGSDSNGHSVISWCKQGCSEYEAYCMLCKCSIAIDNGGKTQISQHSKGKRHKGVACSSLDKGQKKLVVTKASGDNELTLATGKTLWQKSHTDKVTSAEGLWAMTVVNEDISYASCDKACDAFKAMFTDSNIAQDLKLSKSKVSYVISHGLGPYFQEEVLDDIKTSESYYTLEVDETTTVQVKKQFDMHVRYWSGISNCVVVRYLDSEFLGHADAVTLHNVIISSLAAKHIPMSKMLMLSSDGPNVNISLWRKLNDDVKNERQFGLVDIGTCTIHMVHNAFHKAMDALQWGVFDLATDIFCWFKYSSARREDYGEIQSLLELEDHLFMRPVQSRWLSLSNVVDRLLEQLPGLTEYFVTTLPKSKNRTVVTNDRFKKLHKTLKEDGKLTEARLRFVEFITPTFMKFLTLFQTEGPLVHILYEQLSELVRSVMLKFVKPEIVEAKVGKELFDVKYDEYSAQVSDRRLEVGQKTNRLVKTFTELEQKIFLKHVRTFYTALTKALLRSLPLDNSILRRLQCISPEFKSDLNMVEMATLLAKKVPVLSDKEVDLMRDEWKMYCVDENIKSTWYERETTGDDDSADQKSKYERVDHYWQKVLKQETQTGELKYKVMGKLVKACLTLAHGNADVERGFSINKKMLKKEKTAMSEKTVIGQRLVKDAVKQKKGVCNIAMSRALINSVNGAYGRYKVESEQRKRERDIADLKRKQDNEKQRLENEKKLCEEANTRSEKEKTQQREDDALEEMKLAQRLIDDGTNNLNKSLKKKDLQAAKVAQAMIETGQSKLSAALNEQEGINKKRKTQDQKSKPSKKQKK